MVENGVPVSEAYLFGSAARGEFAEYSDIDLAAVSREFEGILFHDIKRQRRKLTSKFRIRNLGVTIVANNIEMLTRFFIECGRFLG